MRMLHLVRERDREREMGRAKVESEQNSNSTINHFSHPHPLNLITTHGNHTCCSACKNEANNGSIYTCKICNFSLHSECSKMPQQITHPFDKQHTFTLLPKPIYPEGNFKCDACGELGDGFSYHCQICSTDLHLLCAVFPLTLTHSSHHHQLHLTFSPPYPHKSFCCHICKNHGTNHWLYTCQACGFDAHLSCTKLLQQHQTPIQRSAPQTHTGFDQMNQGINSEMLSLQEMIRKRSEEQQQLLQAIMSASTRQNQEIQQQILQAYAGNLSQGFNGINNNAGIYQHILSGLSGGGGANLLQALSGAGAGAGGINGLQSLMGGATGGLGGLDLSALFGGLGFM